MKYPQNSAIGDAGEHFFAYTVATQLGWPCRLLDVDIGIDAQVEILDDERNSTGQFLAVQIKTRTDPQTYVIYEGVKHVEYWQSADSPVLIALVDLEDKTVYIKHVEKGGELAPAVPGGDTVKFEFDPSEDLLSQDLAPKLRLLGYAEEIKKIEAILNEIRARCESILQETDTEDVDDMKDYDYYLEMLYDFRPLENRLYEAKVLVLRIRKFTGDCGYETVRCLFVEARDSFKELLERYGYHLHNAEEVKGFLNDYVERSNYLELDPYNPFAVENS